MDHGMSMQLRSACLNYAIELAKGNDLDDGYSADNVLATAKQFEDYIKGQEEEVNMMVGVGSPLLH